MKTIKKMKINKVAIGLMVSLSFPVLAENSYSIYNLRVPISHKLSSWNDINHKYTDWVNVGSKFDCLAWKPASSEVDLGTQFLQSRECSINQERERIEMEKDSFSDKEVETGRFKENQVATESESNTATGSKDFISHTEVAEWGSWNNTENKSCDPWSPGVETISEGSSFQQERTCEQEQVRSRDINNVWASGLITFKEKEEELGTIDSTENKDAVGTRIVRNMCVDILNRGQSTGDKTYTVDPDGVGPLPAKSAYCLMSQGGWTLYDSFGTLTGETGKSSAAYNAKGINSKSAISSAGYSSYVDTINASSYHVTDQYMQFFYGGSTHGFIRKNLPSWVKGVRADVSNQWRGSPNYVTFNSTVKTLSGYQGHTEFSFNGTGNLEFKETSIMWIDAVWVK